MKKKLFSILALLLMAVTGATAQTEELLTTITMNNSLQTEYSVSGRATLSTSGYLETEMVTSGVYAWNNSSSDDIGSVTITAAEGYEITKVVFWNYAFDPMHNEYNNDITDTASPFTCYLKGLMRSLNENMSSGSYGNIAKIEVYGYAAPATVNITANSDGAATPSYWATYYNGTTSFTADVNTTVFQAALSGDQLTLTVVPDREIPADKAVILKSSAATITLTPAATTQTLSGNQLQGTTAEMSGAAGNIYVLNKGTNGVGFYKLKSTGTIGANKAYLTYSGGGSAGARAFFLFDETTGIEMPTAEDGNADAVVFDLQGRRVLNPTKGLYIVNGKKVFINK